jgi:histone arginine demethylase JMJD6
MHVNLVKEFSEAEWVEVSANPPMSEPFLVRGGCALWPAYSVLTFDYLRHLAGREEVRVRGTGTRNETQQMLLREFLDYCQITDERDPLYLADWHYHHSHPEIRELMSPPKAFQSWLEALPKDTRPAWSWLYVGPRNSGTPLHVDTEMSSAWNAVLSGEKEWVIYPPDHPVCLELCSGPLVNSLDSFADQAWTTVQRRGDLIYVPGGWAHSVRNREAGIAFTENFINEFNYEAVGKHLDGEQNKAFRQLIQLARAVHVFRH